MIDTKNYRTLTGKEANEKFEREDIPRLAPKINILVYYLLELRRITMNAALFESNYFIQRHRYHPEERYLFDIAFLGITYDDAKNGKKIRPISHWRYKYYYLIYFGRLPFRKLTMCEWTRITPRGSEQHIYVSSEDLLKDDPESGKPKIHWRLKKENKTYYKNTAEPKHTSPD